MTILSALQSATTQGFIVSFKLEMNFINIRLSEKSQTRNGISFVRVYNQSVPMVSEDTEDTIAKAIAFMINKMKLK